MLQRIYYCPHMSADIRAAVPNFHYCARNRLKLCKHKIPLKLFPAKEPLQSLAIDLLGPLTKIKHGGQFLLFTTCRFSKLTSVVPFRVMDTYTLAVAFTVHWVRHYGPPKSLMSDNGRQFATKLAPFWISRTFIPPPSIRNRMVKVERYTRTMLAMLRSHVNEQ